MREEVSVETYVTQYWAKTREEADGSMSWHPVPYHNLDVGACAVVLWDSLPRLRALMVRLTGLPEATLRATVGFLMSIHDVGKFAEGFQGLCEELKDRLQGRGRTYPYNTRHDTVGYVIWEEVLLDELAGGKLGGEGADPDQLQIVLGPWLRASMGHHGKPPEAQPKVMLREQVPKSVKRDLLAFVRDALALFAPEGLELPLEWEELGQAMERSSWVFAGLAVLADWIGSNHQWFHFAPPAFSVAEYWEQRALPQAREAVAAAGLGTLETRAETGLAALFPAFTEGTALQRFSEALPLEAGPTLVIIEEVTGGGKTEASQVLAHRMIRAGHAEGIFMALPSMATANAMHRRVRALASRLFEEGVEAPRVVLAHSADKTALRMQEVAGDGEYAAGELRASTACRAWLYDSRKKALLAQLGVGTIDQALMGVLPLRHQSLRLFGMSRNVFIVDEVHACDAYVLRLLERLLEFHAALGGSAILMSATLPLQMRRSLTAAFAKGAGYKTPALREQAYPLVTQLGAGGVVETPVAARAELSRELEVSLLSEEADAEARLLEVLAEGGCACWIRNTVVDAMATFRRLQVRLGDRVSLFHSRFTVGDRLEIERSILERFGPTSGPDERAGRLLIATQVVEQSLDLDFDAMVTDLAPADLLIQRAGRLHRHARDMSGRRVEVGQRGRPRLDVLCPSMEEPPTEGWYKALFPRAAYVYPDHGQLWLTARWLAEYRRLRVPEDARSFVEAVYGADAEIPDALISHSDEADGERRAAQTIAADSALALQDGYKATYRVWQEDAHPPTRLGEPTAMLRLVRVKGDRLEPWAGRGELAWELSQVRVREDQLCEAFEGRHAAALEKLRATMPDEGRYVVTLPLEWRDGAWRGQGRAVRKSDVHLTYDPVYGLCFE